ncbi:MAG: glycosyltransferase family A protein [Gaiellales bacterium]
MSPPTIVGAVVVRNEDLWIEAAIRNVAAFCDVIHVADNGSTDGTWEILVGLERELDHLELRRIDDIVESQDLVSGYVGRNVWVFGVDGDEVYDPVGLQTLREELHAEKYRDRWRIKSNVLNAVAVDLAADTATGYLAPPARPITKLFNFAALDAWTGPFIQVLHGSGLGFREGFADGLSENIGDRLDWHASYFRCVHCCFVPRSTLDRPGDASRGRPNAEDLHRAAHGGIRDRLARFRPRSRSRWKNHAYRRGPLTTIDLSPFLAVSRST